MGCLRSHIVILFIRLSTLLFYLDVAEGGTEAEILQALDEAEEEGVWEYVPLSGPYIDVNNSQNVTAQVNEFAVLNCRILYIVGKTVSWMRARDLHLLTVGKFTYTSDGRFRAIHQRGSDDWLLKIHYVQRRDAGAYECQVSTTPPITHTVWLSVVEPKTVILGGPDIYVDSGSSINLTCIVKFIPKPPPFIFWEHNQVLLSYDKTRNGTHVTTSQGDEQSTSQLLIQTADTSHSGKYTCKPATAPTHEIIVHVFHNKGAAPIHQKNISSTSISQNSQSSSSSVSSPPLLSSLPSSPPISTPNITSPSSPDGKQIPKKIQNNASRHKCVHVNIILSIFLCNFIYLLQLH